MSYAPTIDTREDLDILESLDWSEAPSCETFPAPACDNRATHFRGSDVRVHRLPVR